MFFVVAGIISSGYGERAVFSGTGKITSVAEEGFEYERIFGPPSGNLGYYVGSI